MIKDNLDDCNKEQTHKVESVLYLDSTSCDDSSSRIKLEKVDKNESIKEYVNVESLNLSDSDSSTQTIITAEYLRANTEIKGWLVYFLFCILAGNIIAGYKEISSLDIRDYSNNIFLLLAVVTWIGVVFYLSIYTVYAFVLRKSNAVFYAKAYYLIVFALGILGLFEADTNTYETAGLIFGSIVPFLYMTFSEQVLDVIPKEYRSVKSKDYYILSLSLIIPLFFFAIGMGEVLSTNNETQPENIERMDLREGEYSDGRVVFALPAGFTCKTDDSNGVFSFHLENEQGAYVYISSAYDSNFSEGYFDECIEGSEDPSFGEYASEVIHEVKSIVNGSEYFHRVIRYEVNHTFVYRSFALVASKDKNMLCVLSCYDTQENDYVVDIIKSMRL